MRPSDNSRSNDNSPNYSRFFANRPNGHFENATRNPIAHSEVLEFIKNFQQVKQNANVHEIREQQFIYTICNEYSQERINASRSSENLIKILQNKGANSITKMNAIEEYISRQEESNNSATNADELCFYNNGKTLFSIIKRCTETLSRVVETDANNNTNLDQERCDRCLPGHRNSYHVSSGGMRGGDTAAIVAGDLILTVGLAACTIM